MALRQEVQRQRDWNCERDAAAAYGRAFEDPAVDVVEMSNTSGWLVTYYLRYGQTDEALAQRGAHTQSWQGLVTSASLAERLGRFEEAEATYREAATHYQNPSQLLGFYYRAVIVRKDTFYQAAWKAELERVFPHGLTPVPTGAGKPAHGLSSIATASSRAALAC
jgi:hypothetical protein